MVIPNLTRAAIGQAQKDNIFRGHAQMAHRRARFLHANGPKVQCLRRSAGVLKVPVTSPCIAAGEIDDVERNLVFHQRANKAHLCSIVVFVCAEYQDGFGKRIDAKFQVVSGEYLAGSISYFHLSPEEPTPPRWKQKSN